VPLERLEANLQRQGIWPCESNRPIYAAIDRFIQLREMKSVLPDFGYLGKNGMLLMGESGLGKSTAFRSILLASDYEQLTPDQTPPDDKKQYFYQITAQNRDIAERILDKALLHGIPVIVDEFNMVRSGIFKSYLDGKFPKASPYYGQTPAPGFVLLMTGNPPEKYKGRSPITPTLIDQTVCMSWTKPYTPTDFDEILAAALGGKPPRR